MLYGLFLELNSRLGLNSLIIRMFDKAHLGNEVRLLDQCLRSRAAGDHEMQARRAVEAKPFQYLAGIEPAKMQSVCKFIQHDQIISIAGDLFFGDLPTT